MTMNFRTVKSNLVTLLGTQGSGVFRTVGYQDLGKSADEISDTDRLVEVYYSSGSFPNPAGSMSRQAQHEITFRLDLSVSRKTSVDLSALRNPASTAVEIAAALAALEPAKELVDESFDEMVDAVYQIVMDQRNIELGGDKYSVASRWIERVNKDEPITRGEYAILTGNMVLTCNVKETFDGYTATQGDIVDVELEHNTIDSQQTDTAKAGVYLGS